MFDVQIQIRLLFQDGRTDVYCTEVTGAKSMEGRMKDYFAAVTGKRPTLRIIRNWRGFKISE